MNVSIIPRAAAAALAVFLIGACSDTTGLSDEDGPDAPDVPATQETATVDFTFSRITGGTSARVAAWFASTAGTAPPLELDTIASLTVTVDSIQALSVTEDDDGDAEWITVTLDSPVTIDLITLPAEGESPLVVASGTLEAGDYHNVRLFISDASIEFTGPISIGAAFTFEPDTSYTVTVPSSDQTGIKTDLAFTADEGTDVNLLFDENATFANVHLTGNGAVMLAPVIRARGS